MTYLSGQPQLSESELCALRLDGELTSFHYFLDAPDRTQDRARRILGTHFDDLVLTSWSAAWALHCGAEPMRHIASYRSTRVHIPRKAELTIEQRTLQNTDTAKGCTTPLRTLTDVLKIQGEEHRVLNTAHTLMTRYALTSQAVTAHINRVTTPSHKTLVLHRLSAIQQLYPSDTR